MKENRNVILTMVIAGGLAGMGAGLYYLTGIEDWETTISSVPSMGFNGIAVAFLGGLSPFGSILASFFIQHITTGGGNVDLTVYSPQISSLISSLIIFLCAFSGFLKERLQARCGRAMSAVPRAPSLRKNRKEVRRNDTADPVYDHFCLGPASRRPGRLLLGAFRRHQHRP